MEYLFIPKPIGGIDGDLGKFLNSLFLIARRTADTSIGDIY